MEMAREDERKTALVTAIGSFSAREVIAGCRREGMRIIGCDIYPAEWVADSADVDVCYRAPYATDETAYRAFLAEVCEKEHVDFVLPLTDVEVDVLQKWRMESMDATKESEVTAEFAPLHAVLCMSGVETIRLCRDKEKMQNFLSERGFAGQSREGNLLRLWRQKRDLDMRISLIRWLSSRLTGEAVRDWLV
ncbi:MAG: hypothetical protein V8S27_06305 [Lachnospiraceae bacterium]